MLQHLLSILYNMNHYTLFSDIDECVNASYQCRNGTCSNFDGGWNCSCPGGYTLNSTDKYFQNCVGKLF